MPISKNEMKFIRSLAQKKFRQQSGLFVCEGEKMVREAMDSSFEVEKVYYRDDIGEDAMAAISQLTTPSPVLALVRIPKGHLEQMSGAEAARACPRDALVLGLDSVRNPGNLGTILRLADWFGIRNVYASCDTVELFNPKVVQATMGAIFRVDVTYCPLPEMLKDYTAAGNLVFGTFLDGDNIYTSHLGQASQGRMILMGSESFGIGPECEAYVSGKILIPSYAQGSESLNVAIATAIVCAEFRRRECFG